MSHTVLGRVYPRWTLVRRTAGRGKRKVCGSLVFTEHISLTMPPSKEGARAMGWQVSKVPGHGCRDEKTRPLGSGHYELHIHPLDIRQPTLLVSNERVTPQCPANQFLSLRSQLLSMK